jgi:starch synthase
MVAALADQGVEIYVAMPNYRRMFNGNIFHLHERELRKYHEVLSDARLHLAQDGRSWLK